nr:MAG TPA: hypothetical protein [Bacteriophage sp.]
MWVSEFIIPAAKNSQILSTGSLTVSSLIVSI